MTNSREQFEEWFGPTKERMKKDGLGLIAIRRLHQKQWEAWQASRQCIEVDIASHTEFEIEHIASPEKEGYSIGWIDGRNYAANQVAKAGIKIKGA